MSLSMKMPLKQAQRIADAFLDSIGPGVVRAEVKGSVIRQVRLVGDIEIVAQPRLEQRAAGGQESLFASRPSELVSLLWECLDDMVSAGRIVPLKSASLIDQSAAARTGLDLVDVGGGTYCEVDGRWSTKRIAGSKYFKLWLVKPRVQVDLFMPTEATWGSIATIRTGSAAFSKALVSRWKISRMGRRFDGGVLYDHRGHVIPTPEERDVFRATGFQWVDPPQRRGWNDLISVS